MPTLNEYTDRDGFYILARPPDAGNITYQVDNIGERILQRLGFADGDEVGWNTIHALQIPDLIYTGEEGASENDVPVNLDKSTDTNYLSPSRAGKLAEELASLSHVKEEEIEEIREILEPPTYSDANETKDIPDLSPEPHHMDEPLESVSAEGWHPQDVILICQALSSFAKREELSEARSTRAYALLFGLIDSADIPFEHADFTDYDHLSGGVDSALTQWMENQADETWGENLIPDE